MDKKLCDCYHTKMKEYRLYNPLNGKPIRKEYEIGVCNGTRECEECKCGGDKKKCDFHEEVRNG